MSTNLKNGPDEKRAAAIRHRIARMSHAAKSAHFGSSLSCVEILMAVVQASNVRVDNVDAADRDRIILSKGHAAMAYYATLESFGLLEERHLDSYLRDGSALWGHVTRNPMVPAIDASTGSLGHGLGLALGFLQAYRLRNWSARAFCILSDGELDEGSTWEAALYAGARSFSPLVAVVDYNKIQSLDRVAAVLDLEPLCDKWRAFRWDVVEVDGHDLGALGEALAATSRNAPRLIIAHTVKARGVVRIENTVASHYHPASENDVSLLARDI